LLASNVLSANAFNAPGVAIGSVRIYLNPANGRFNQRDAFAGNNEDPQTLHKYLYCNDDSVNMIDPLGMQGTAVELMTVLTIAAIGYALLAPAFAGAYQNSFFRTQFLQAMWQLQAMVGNSVGFLVAQMQRALEVIKDAINQAVKWTKKTAKELWQMPKNFIVKSLGPTIFQFDVACLLVRPDWIVLEYNGANSIQTDINRIWMRAEYAVVWNTPHPGYTVDEFPYASTVEGGEGGPALVHYAPKAPINENAVQGGLLQYWLYDYQMKGKPGPFLNVPVPL
jgi:RHS repeat-associated protein